MATVDGMTAQKMQQILDDTIASADIQGSSLVFTRYGGDTFVAGDFQAYITSQIGTQITDGIAAAVPAAVAGGLTNKGNLSGAITFVGNTPQDMVNRLFTATLTGNVTLNSTAFPTPSIAGTQFAIVFKQDATGGRTLTLTGIKKSQGLLALSTAANAIDIVSFLYDGTNWYAGLMGVGFA